MQDSKLVGGRRSRCRAPPRLPVVGEGVVPLVRHEVEVALHLTNETLPVVGGHYDGRHGALGASEGLLEDHLQSLVEGELAQVVNDTHHKLARHSIQTHQQRIVHDEELGQEEGIDVEAVYQSVLQKLLTKTIFVVVHVLTETERGSDMHVKISRGVAMVTIAVNRIFPWKAQSKH